MSVLILRSEETKRAKTFRVRVLSHDVTLTVSATCQEAGSRQAVEDVLTDVVAAIVERLGPIALPDKRRGPPPPTPPPPAPRHRGEDE